MIVVFTTINSDKGSKDEQGVTPGKERSEKGKAGQTGKDTDMEDIDGAVEPPKKKQKLKLICNLPPV